MGASVSYTFYQGSQVCSGTAHPVGYVEIGTAWSMTFFERPTITRSAQAHPPNTLSHTTSNGGHLAVLRRHIFHFQPPSPRLQPPPHFTTTLPLRTVCLLPPPSPPTHPHHITSLCLFLLNSIAFKGDAFFPPNHCDSFPCCLSTGPLDPFLLLSALSSIPTSSSASLFNSSSSPLSFLVSSSSLGLQLLTHRADTAHQPTSRPHYWHTCVHVHVSVCVPGAVVTVGPHRV